MQGEPGVDYDDANLNPLICDLCKMKFKSLDELGEHQKQNHDMQGKSFLFTEFVFLQDMNQPKVLLQDNVVWEQKQMFGSKMELMAPLLVV